MIGSLGNLVWDSIILYQSYLYPSPEMSDRELMEPLLDYDQ